MSMDDGATVAPDETEGIAPEAIEVVGQGEEAVTPDEPEVDLFDLDSVGDQFVTVGDERVKLSDLRNGYLRQSDYTRKTQELARQREEAQWGLTLQRAYEQNPALAIQILSSQMAQAQPTAVEQPPEDPIERRLWEQQQYIEQTLAPIQQSHAEQELQRIVGSLQTKYDGASYAFDPKAVVQRAVELGHQDPYRLEDVYKQMAFDEMFGRELAQRDFASQNDADNASRRAAASAITSHGNGTAASMASPPSPPKSLREAFADAWEANVGQRPF
jgi:hypothetical protein